MRILVVEDDDATRCAMVRTLEAAGYEVTQAHGDRDALPVLEGDAQVDLLIVDLVMPGVNGFALARMRRHDFKVVYVAGYDDVRTDEAIGPILRKPVMPDVAHDDPRDAGRLHVKSERGRPDRKNRQRSV